MNGTCAGGTGAFLDQMASLLNTDTLGLNELAKGYKTIYPIASRCRGFRKNRYTTSFKRRSSKRRYSSFSFTSSCKSNNKWTSLWKTNKRKCGILRWTIKLFT